MIPQTCKNTKLFARMAERIRRMFHNMWSNLMRSVVHRGDAGCAEGFHKMTSRRWQNFRFTPNADRSEKTPYFSTPLASLR